MTNAQIIAEVVIGTKTMGSDDFIDFYQTHGYLPFNTYSTWKKLGYQVKKGEKATLSTRLWKYTNKPVEVVETANGEENEVDPNHYFLKLSHLFGINQVEKVGKATIGLLQIEEF